MILDFDPYFINMDYFNENNVKLKELLVNSSSTIIVNKIYGIYCGSSDNLHFEKEKNLIGIEKK